MAGKRQGESEVEHPRKKNCFAVHRPSLAVVDVLRAYGRAIVSQYCKLPTACLRSVVPEAFSSSTSTPIREEFGPKTEVSHDGASFLRSVAGCFSVVGRIPRSKPRSIRERRTARAFPRGIPRFSCQDLPWGLYYLRLAHHSDSEEQLALPSVRFACLLPEATPYGYRAAILRMPCNLDASSSIPISSSAW